MITKKGKKVKIETSGQAHIQTTFNNIIISITNDIGQVIDGPLLGKCVLKDLKKIRLMRRK